MIRYKKKILIFILALLSSNLLIGCTPNKTYQTAADSKYAYQEKDYNDSFQNLSKLLNVDKTELESKLTLKNGNDTLKLVPAMNTSKDLDFYKSLVVYGDEEYTKLYFQNKKMKNEQQAKNYYNSNMKDMWKKSPPNSLFFLISLNNERVGIISTSTLTSSDEITIGYVTEQSKANKGIATNSLKIMVQLLKYMKDNSIYNYSKLALWIFDENTGSIKVAEKNGFKLSEKNEAKQLSKYTLKI